MAPHDLLLNPLSTGQIRGGGPQETRGPSLLSGLYSELFSHGPGHFRSGLISLPAVSALQLFLFPFGSFVVPPPVLLMEPQSSLGSHMQ